MIKTLKFYAKEAVLRAKYMTSKDCLFCKIIKGEVKSKFIYENNFVVAFDDINPVAEVHILIVPKRHIDSVMSIGDDDSVDIVEMHKAAQKLVGEKKLGSFRLAFNGGKYQHVGHLHMHLLAGDKVDWRKL